MASATTELGEINYELTGDLRVAIYTKEDRTCSFQFGQHSVETGTLYFTKRGSGWIPPARPTCPLIQDEHVDHVFKVLGAWVREHIKDSNLLAAREYVLRREADQLQEEVDNAMAVIAEHYPKLQKIRADLDDVISRRLNHEALPNDIPPTACYAAAPPEDYVPGYTKPEVE